MINFGVIGTNWITEAFINAVSHIEDFHLYAVYSRTEERAKSFAEKYQASAIFTDLEEMARDEQLDAVYIASPNSLHSRQAVLFLNQKKHVLCEKPIAANAIEAAEMIAAAKENKVLLMEAMKSTQMPAFQQIQENLHKIGKIRRYTGTYCQYSSRYDAFKRGEVRNAFNPEFSSGALMDLGVYCLYPLVTLFGSPERVQASATLLSTGVDGQGSLLLTYPDMEAVIQYSKLADSSVPSEIQGEKGSIMIDKISSPENVWIEYKDGTVENISESIDFPDMYYEANEFIELLKSQKTESAINSFSASLSVMKIMDTARKQTGIIFPSDR
ncbi:Gfo/Idh/MocA family protein [Bacillus massiliglaciei]|uniref:Gfo/Idh/MocA family protein n=1 Tax=Bacillus massiliglaciei TaxID=1816693 RepID=UPI000ACF6BA3|nr:Gfo/Idh/MocA family oxidoreductase [Bacillus massiliglaciei]